MKAMGSGGQWVPCHIALHRHDALADTNAVNVTGCLAAHCHADGVPGLLPGAADAAPPMDAADVADAADAPDAAAQGTAAADEQQRARPKCPSCKAPYAPNQHKCGKCSMDLKAHKAQVKAERLADRDMDPSKARTQFHEACLRYNGASAGMQLLVMEFHPKCAGKRVQMNGEHSCLLPLPLGLLLVLLMLCGGSGGPQRLPLSQRGCYCSEREAAAAPRGAAAAAAAGVCPAVGAIMMGGGASLRHCPRNPCGCSTCCCKTSRRCCSYRCTCTWLLWCAATCMVNQVLLLLQSTEQQPRLWRGCRVFVMPSHCSRQPARSTMR